MSKPSNSSGYCPECDAARIVPKNEPTELQKAVEIMRIAALVSKPEEAKHIYVLIAAAKQIESYKTKLLIAETTIDELQPLIGKLIGLQDELETAKADRNKAALKERQNYLPKLSALQKENEELKHQLKQEKKAYVDSIDILAGTVKQRDSLKSALKMCAEALQRLWDEDEMGWIVDASSSECVKCGARGLTALPLPHAEGCVQGYIYKALSNPHVQQALENK